MNSYIKQEGPTSGDIDTNHTTYYLYAPPVHAKRKSNL